MDTTVEVPKTTAEAGSLSDHKAIRNAQRSGKPLTETITPKPVSEPQKTETPSAPKGETSGVPETPVSESAGVSETPPSQDKDKPKPPKRDTAEDRVKTLLEERRAQDRRIAELEARINQPAKPAEPPKPEAKPEGEPDLDEYLTKAPEGETYGKTLARFNRDHYTWLQREHEKTVAATERAKTFQTKLDTAKQKHGADVVAQAMGSPNDPGSGILLARGVLGQLVNSYENGIDVVVHLHQNPEIYQQIRSMPPEQQFIECAILARTLNAPKAQASPEKPKPQPAPVSRVAPPPPTVGGSSVPDARSTAEAGSMAEHKRLRLAQQRRAG